MFKRATNHQEPTVQITVDGLPVTASRGDTVSAAILTAGCVEPYRYTAVNGTPRAPYCMMGVCFDCLVTIDGIGNRQGCLIPVSDGMVITRQNGKREIES